MSETETATKLLPCPFCGEDPEIEQIGNDHTKTRKTQIRCPRCSVTMRVGAIANSVAWTRRQVISQWNKRTGTP